MVQSSSDIFGNLTPQLDSSLIKKLFLLSNKMSECNLPLDKRTVLSFRNQYDSVKKKPLYLEMWLFGVIKVERGTQKAELNMWLLYPNPKNRRVILFSDSHGCNQGVYHYTDIELCNQEDYRYGKPCKELIDEGNYLDNQNINLRINFNVETQVNISDNFLRITPKRINIEELNSAIGWYGGINFRLRDFHVDIETDPEFVDDTGKYDIYIFKSWEVEWGLDGSRVWMDDPDDPKYGVPKQAWKHLYYDA